MVEYEFISAGMRFFLLALTGDGAKLLDMMRRATQSVIWQFQKGGFRFQSALIVLYPFEALAIIFLDLLLRGKTPARILVLANLLIGAFVAPFIINAIKIDKPPPDGPEKKKKKEKKGKDGPTKEKEE
jgi:hypothetical protein